MEMMNLAIVIAMIWSRISIDGPLISRIKQITAIEERVEFA